MRKATATTVLALGLVFGTAACSGTVTKSGVKAKILKETKNLTPAVTPAEAQCIVEQLWITYDSNAIKTLGANDHTFTEDELAKIAKISNDCVTSK